MIYTSSMKAVLLAAVLGSALAAGLDDLDGLATGKGSRRTKFGRTRSDRFYDRLHEAQTRKRQTIDRKMERFAKVEGFNQPAIQQAMKDPSVMAAAAAAMQNMSPNQLKMCTDFAKGMKPDQIKKYAQQYNSKM